MNTSSSTHRRPAWLKSGLALAVAGLAWSVVAFAEQQSPKVNVKVDEQAITRSLGTETGSFAPVVKRVAPSVVKVMVTEKARAVPVEEVPPFLDDPIFRHFFGNPYDNGQERGQRRALRQPPQEGLGSGVIVSPDGYILTNNHVVNNADVIKVTLADGREINAKVIGTDPQSDLAVIKVDTKDLPAATFADSEKVQVGDIVLAVGNPFGIGQTVTSGMVSGLGRATLGLDYEDFIQTDAAINPGNSGGALVDVQGRLVGINTAILSRTGGFQGIGFAIPANMARSIMEQLVRDGKVVRGYLGVSIQDINSELADAFNIKTREGALVADVIPGSPAAKAGLQTGDVITHFAGKPVRDGRNLKLAVASVSPGSEVNLKVSRNGSTEEFKIKIGDQPRKSGLSRNDRDPRGGSQKGDEGTLNGVGVTDLSRQMRREFGIPANVQGALVTEVDPSSAAAQAGLQPGDVIQEINRQPVASADDAIKLTQEDRGDGKTLLRVWSQRGTRYIVVDESGNGKD